MDDIAEDLDQESGEQEEASEPVVDDRQLSKLKKENQSLRQRLRRTELEAKFGTDVVELIPEELPLTKWEEFAGRLSERMPKQQTEQTEPEPEVEAEEPEPTVLSSVANTPPPGTQVPGKMLTPAEHRELQKRNPIEADRLAREGKVAWHGQAVGDGWEAAWDIPGTP